MKFTTFAGIVCTAILMIIAGMFILDAYLDKRICEADGGAYVRGGMGNNVCIVHGREIDI